MKKAFFIGLSLFIVTVSSGQEIELQGTYGANFLGAEVIEFKGKDSFYFGGFYCTYGMYGTGKCEIRNNYLYLYFEKSRAAEDRIKPPEITKVASDDSIAVLNITCVDSSGNPIPGVTVQVRRMGRTVTEGIVSNSYGKASFAARKSNMPVIVQTSSAGYRSNPVNITNYSGYDILVFHKKLLFDNALNNGEVFIYEIDELSEDLISMRPEHSKGPFRKYTRK